MPVPAKETADLEQVCIDMVTERYNYRSRIGVVSKSLAAKRPSAPAKPDYISTLLNPYKSYVPACL
jgi:hypothetical protein